MKGKTVARTLAPYLDSLFKESAERRGSLERRHTALVQGVAQSTGPWFRGGTGHGAPFHGRHISRISPSITAWGWWPDDLRRASVSVSAGETP